ncbi:MAG: hypothetical protein KBS97_01055 [Firmicutes bacterium]|nr:hypothetical protein [Candidatus Fiminaster equi]
MFIIGFIAPITFIFTIPFVVIPSFFAVSAINTIAPNKNTHEGLGFFIMFRAYFTQLFRGGYKVIIGFLKSLAVFIISSAILSAILTTTILNKDPQFIDFRNQVAVMTDANQIAEALTNFMNTNVTFNKISIIINGVSSFLAFYMFAHHFAVNSFKYNYNFIASLPLPMQDLNLIHKNVVKQNRREFYKDYYKANWLLAILLVLGYAGGFLISYFFINNIDMVQMSVIGLFGSFIVLMLFVPYFLNASQITFSKYRSKYVETLITLTKESIEELKKTQTITEEKEKEVLKLIESQKEEPEDKDKENK